MNELDLLERSFRAPDEASVTAAEERVIARYRAAPGRRARPRKPLLGVAVGLAAALALVVLALTAGRGHDSTAVARTLNDLARAASRQAGAAPGDYSYRRTRSDYGGSGTYPVDGASVTFSWHTPATTEEWQSTSGDLIRCTRAGIAELKSAADRRAWVKAGSPVYEPLSGALGYERFRGSVPALAGTPGDRLPTDPGAIATLVERLKYHDAGSILENVRELLAWRKVSPQATASLFRYLATVPGLTVVRGARTHGGQTGVGLGVAGNGLSGSERWVNRFLIFDRATSRLIGYRERAPGAPVTQLGRDRAWVDYLAQGSVALDVSPPAPGVTGTVGESAERSCAGLARP